MVVPMLTLVLVALVLTAESWLPGQLFLPLTLDDFPAWSAGEVEADLEPHPNPNWTMSDVLHLLVPGLAVTSEALARGEVPLWDPSQALGLPHIDQVHYSVLYPPAWIPLVLGLNGLALLAWFHLVAAGLGMLVYLRSIHRSTVAAATGALAFVCSAWITARLHSFPVVGAAVWMPWVLWGLQRGAETGRARYYLGGAVALALSMLAGFPQVTLLIGCTAGLIELGRMVRGLVGKKAGAMSGLAGLAALGLGVAFSAVQVLPTLHYMEADSARSEQDLKVLSQEGLEWPLLNQLVAPDFYADAGLPGLNPMALGTIRQASAPAAINRAETSMSVGVVALILAILTMLYGRTWLSRLWTLIVLVVFTLLLWPELFAQAAAWLPPLRFGNPKRLLLISTFGLSVLAAGGVDVLRRPFLRITSLGWFLSFAVTAWTVWLMVAVPSTSTSGDINDWALRLAEEFSLGQVTAEQFFMFSGMEPESFVRAASTSFRSTLIALLAALMALLIFRPRARPIQSGWGCLARQAPALLPGAVLVELMLSAFPLLRSAPAAAVTTDSTQVASLSASPLVDIARSCAAETGVPPRMARFGNDPPFLRPNFPGLFGLHDLQAYAPMAPRRTMQLLGSFAPAMSINGSQIGGFSSAEEMASPLVDMLGVAAVLTQDAELLPPGYTEAGVVGHVRVLRNDEVFPRAWCVTDVSDVAIEGVRLNWLSSKRFDPLRAVVLDEPFDWTPGQPFAPDPALGLPLDLQEEDLSDSGADAAEGVSGEASDAVNSEGVGDEVAEPVAGGPADADPADGTDEAGADERDDGLDVLVADTEAEVSDGAVADREAEIEEGGSDESESETVLSPLDLADLVPFSARAVVIDVYSPGSITLRVGPGPDAALVIAESWSDNWQATVDGEVVPLQRANHALMALPVPASAGSDVTLRYADPLLTQGLFMALGAGLAFAAVVFVVRRRDRQRGQALSVSSRPGNVAL